MGAVLSLLVVVLAFPPFGTSGTDRSVSSRSPVKASGGPVRPAESPQSTNIAASPVATLKQDQDRLACSTVTVRREILVNIALQHLWACDHDHLVLSTAVTTGAVDRDEPTLPGTWHVYAKQTNRWLSGPGYDDHVNFWMPYNGGYGLHDSPWQRFAYGSAKYASRGSHGCVQIPTATMAKLYAWAPVGTLVDTVA